GNDMIIAATKGGAPTHPDWYYNLKKHPRITVEVGTATFPVEATEVTGEERDELWRRLIELRPGFAVYETKTSRIFPMFRLTRLSWRQRTARPQVQQPRYCGAVATSTFCSS